MSWANELYAVYDKALTLTSEREPLLPVSHSTAKAQLEVTIDSSGNFLGAVQITDEASAVTVIPVTEDSGARSSGICPHPYADYLAYTAGDYGKYCSADKSNGKKFEAYIKQLEEWKNSGYSHPSVDALYDYLSKGTLVEDLVRARVLKTDDQSKLTSDKVQKIDQSACFVRFIVSGSAVEKTWLDRSLYDKFIDYNRSVQTEKALCYATGEETYCTYKHPSKVLNEGDKGKLFSANDEAGYSFRGRFLNKEQAVSIGYEFSQKMHNGLKWLRKRQGISIGSLTLIVWD
ncbi:MAG: type I-C CRISPR-associated protein Cas8c/Csd1, partial [Oscillospiraceae bacterium]|nr:type I-C CRISPR-associated protein Cas8c/Csd1 [Oscillospiraceae bacterium]